MDVTGKVVPTTEDFHRLLLMLMSPVRLNRGGVMILVHSKTNME